MKNTHTPIIISTLVLVLLGACSKNNTTSDITCSSSPDYTNNTKKIIDANCTSSGCHNSGSSRGDFTTYAGIKPFLDNGSFTREVITNKTMPQGSKLSTDDYNLLFCWSKNNFAQ